MTHSIIVLTSWVTVLSIALAYIDYRKIIADESISQYSKAKRGGIVMILNIGLGIIFNEVYGSNILIVSIYAQLIYWTVFDVSLNRMRKKSIFYTSNNNRDDNDSIFDKVFNFLPNPYSGVFQVCVKIGLIVITLINFR